LSMGRYVNLSGVMLFLLYFLEKLNCLLMLPRLHIFSKHSIPWKAVAMAASFGPTHREVHWSLSQVISCVFLCLKSGYHAFTFSGLQSHHCEGSEKKSHQTVSLWPAATVGPNFPPWEVAASDYVSKVPQLKGESMAPCHHLKELMKQPDWVTWNLQVAKQWHCDQNGEGYMTGTAKPFFSLWSTPFSLIFPSLTLSTTLLSIILNHTNFIDKQSCDLIHTHTHKNFWTGLQHLLSLRHWALSLIYALHSNISSQPPLSIMDNIWWELYDISHTCLLSTPQT
jgi:hypothetical protein